MSVSVYICVVRALAEGFIAPSKKTSKTWNVCINKILFKASKENKNNQKGGKFLFVTLFETNKKKGRLENVHTESFYGNLSLT